MMFSVRMRAELHGRHTSGAERLVGKDALEKTVLELLKRPKEYDSLNIKVETVDKIQKIGKALPVSSYRFRNCREARAKAVELLRSYIDETILHKAINTLSKGANPSGGNMRGALIMDIETGKRLEPDKSRGIRTILVDWEDRELVKEQLLSSGYTERTLDALAIATKNVRCGVLAEICWSDDPDYTTGYIASPSLGYVRLSPMKERGNPLGGRVYFVRKKESSKVIECLEKEAFLIVSL